MTEPNFRYRPGHCQVYSISATALATVGCTQFLQLAWPLSGVLNLCFLRESISCDGVLVKPVAVMTLRPPGAPAPAKSNGVLPKGAEVVTLTRSCT